jgi:hypothetical protein
MFNHELEVGSSKRVTFLFTSIKHLTISKDLCYFKILWNKAENDMEKARLKIIY